jgi:Ser/Thr protein kinase RdoA (MazF antagonist)
MTDRFDRATEVAYRACKHWSCITSVPVLFMQRENSVFTVETTRGPAALRVHRHGYHSKQAIVSEMKWMAHLAACGLKVPEPLSNLENTYLAEIAFEGQIYFVDVLSWLDGTPLGNSIDPLPYNKAELRAIFFNLGEAIARLHAASDTWVIPADFQRHAWDVDGFVGETPFWGAFWNAGELTDGERSLLSQARLKAVAVLRSLKHKGADYGLIHADFVRQNILVTADGLRIIDFDDSGFGFRMYDIATALVKNRAEPHYDVLKQSLFSGYRAQRQLSLMDEQALDVFLALRDFAYLGWMEARRSEVGVAERMPGIRAATVAAATLFLASQFTS